MSRDIPHAVLARKKRGFNAPMSHRTDALGRLVEGSRDELVPGLERVWTGLAHAPRRRRRDRGFLMFALAQWVSWRRGVHQMLKAAGS